MKQEQIVGPEHASHLTPSGTLVNADKAVVIREVLTRYALNPHHPRGVDKARLFLAKLGMDAA